MAADDFDLRLDLTRTAARLRDTAWLLERGQDPAEVAKMLRELAEEVVRLPVNAREPTPQGRFGMEWWNGLTKIERACWLEAGGSARSADAWEAFQRQQDKASP
jgi:hypothetical protein